jgi:hypothetical protein
MAKRSRRSKQARAVAVTAHKHYTTKVVLALALAVEAVRSPRYFSDKTLRRFGERLNWDEHVRSFSRDEFKKAYRLSREAFQGVLEGIRAVLTTGDQLQAARSSSGPVAPEVRLAVTLRWLAGGSFHDIHRLHKISKEEMFNSIWKVVDAVNNHEPWKFSFPFGDAEALAHLEAGFRAKVRFIAVVARCDIYITCLGARA